MGFSISWLAVHGLARADILARLDATDTGRLQEIPEAALSIADLPDGWTILFSQDFDFAASERVHPLFDAPVVGCQVHEGIMASVAFGAQPGGQSWGLMHEGYNGVRDLTVTGDSPPAFTEARDRAEAAQAAEGDNAGVDFYFDVPIDTAFALTRFRHNHFEFDWGQPVWTVVTAPFAPAPSWF